MYVQRNSGGRPFETVAGANPLAQHYTRLTQAEYEKILEIHTERAATVHSAYRELGATDADIGDICEKNFWGPEPQEPVGIPWNGKYREITFSR